MVVAPLRPCLSPQCHKLTRVGRCDACRTKREQQRGCAAARGYGAAWRRYVAVFRREYPLCGMRPPSAPDTLHSRCVQDGRYTPMSDVDHIVRVSGPDDAHFWDPANHQALCHACHSAKTQREGG